MPDISKQAAEYTQKKELETLTKPQSKFTHDQLMDALVWCWDGFDRAGILFFPIFQTAKQIIGNDDLAGDGIDIGVRRLEWESGSKPILDVFLDHYGVTPLVEKDRTTYIHNTVPVRVHIYEDHECINNCDTVVYRMEHFKIPNPYQQFEKIYG